MKRPHAVTVAFVLGLLLPPFSFAERRFGAAAGREVQRSPLTRAGVPSTIRVGAVAEGCPDA